MKRKEKKFVSLKKIRIREKKIIFKENIFPRNQWT